MMGKSEIDGGTPATSATIATGENGWPCLDPILGKISDALQKTLAQHNPTPENLKVAAERIYGAFHQGLNDERPQNRPTSEIRTEEQLKKFIEHCESLNNLIDEMNQPAKSALFYENGNKGLEKFQTSLGFWVEYGRHAYSSFDATQFSGGRPPKLAAQYVTNETAYQYFRISKKKPTFTTDTITSAISGVWPETLRQVFDAFGIDASIEAQVKSLRKAIPKKEWQLFAEAREKTLPI